MSVPAVEVEDEPVVVERSSPVRRKRSVAPTLSSSLRLQRDEWSARCLQLRTKVEALSADKVKLESEKGELQHELEAVHDELRATQQQRDSLREGLSSMMSVTSSVGTANDQSAPKEGEVGEKHKEDSVDMLFRRLVAFYSEYNPSKAVEEIRSLAEKYVDTDHAELFAVLNERYGVSHTTSAEGGSSGDGSRVLVTLRDFIGRTFKSSPGGDTTSSKSAPEIVLRLQEDKKRLEEKIVAIEDRVETERSISASLREINAALTAELEKRLSTEDPSSESGAGAAPAINPAQTSTASGESTDLDAIDEVEV
jgi:hypothetical protein